MYLPLLRLDGFHWFWSRFILMYWLGVLISADGGTLRFFCHIPGIFYPSRLVQPHVIFCLLIPFHLLLSLSFAFVDFSFMLSNLIMLSFIAVVCLSLLCDRLGEEGKVFSSICHMIGNVKTVLGLCKHTL